MWGRLGGLLEIRPPVVLLDPFAVLLDPAAVVPMQVLLWSVRGAFLELWLRQTSITSLRGVATSSILRHDPHIVREAMLPVH